MSVEDDIRKFAKFLTPISLSAGRARLRVSLKAKEEFKNSSIKLDELLAFIKSLDFINDIKFNKLIGSITIDYKSELLDQKLFEALKSNELLEKYIKDIEVLVSELIKKYKEK